MHYGFVAVPSTVDQLMGAFAEVWRSHELASRATLSSMDEFLSWKKDNERLVSAADWTPQDPGVAVYGFLQDGGWAVLLDASCVLCSDMEALATLSQSFGSCLSFTISTAGSSASFASYAQGRLVRSIESLDGKVTTAGDPIPEETGLQMDSYFLGESEELQRRLGIRFLGDSAPQEVTAIATVDRTDYAALLTQHKVAEPSAAAPRKKPWWRPW